MWFDRVVVEPRDVGSVADRIAWVMQDDAARVVAAEFCHFVRAAVPVRLRTAPVLCN